MMSNMPALKNYRTIIALPALLLAVLLSSCAQQSGQAQSGQMQAGQAQAGETQAKYTNPGRPEVYSADERGYEKPWPFGDLGNNPQ
jgi:guanyl-specific ribonuclease Sa